MRLLHARRAVDAVFDEANLVSCAGLVPVMGLAEQVDLAGLVTSRVRPDLSTGSNPGAKAAAVVAGMAAGADSIDDLDVLRHGGMATLFAGVYAPSTLGSFLRFFTWGHALQLEAAARDLLAALAAATPLLPGAGRQAYVDVDSLLRRVYGHAKQGAGFGHAKVGGYNVRLRGLSPLVATISTATAAPVIAATRLRGGNAGSARGAASLVTQAVRTARACGATGRILVRADSAFGSGPVATACRNAGANFSLTLQSNPKLRAAIASIDETAWTPVRYPGAVFDEDTRGWISEAEVAETVYTAFESTRHKITARLVVRRVKERNPAPPGQEELFPLWRYHAFLTDTGESTVDADLTHRGHAVVEQVFADLIDGPLAHLPSGRFAANAAWLTLTAMTRNLLRATGCLTSPRYATARTATIRRQLVTIPARLARCARRLTLHLPTHWPWQLPWQTVFNRVHAPPATT
ncbi:IS1380 family transposase [Dactylosporangium sp. CA-139066]|uniref:IS1380 family transposase n=1 Tax=Dactylosporangium sp. CA-139066 TaxID=3239930 RepID=UPI003D94A32B